jgi:hypothetical protein
MQTLQARVSFSNGPGNAVVAVAAALWAAVEGRRLAARLLVETKCTEFSKLKRAGTFRVFEGELSDR